MGLRERRVADRWGRVDVARCIRHAPVRQPQVGGQDLPDRVVDGQDLARDRVVELRAACCRLREVRRRRDVHSVRASAAETSVTRRPRKAR